MNFIRSWFLLSGVIISIQVAHCIKPDPNSKKDDKYVNQNSKNILKNSVKDSKRKTNEDSEDSKIYGNYKKNKKYNHKNDLESILKYMENKNRETNHDDNNIQTEKHSGYSDENKGQGHMNDLSTKYKRKNNLQVTGNKSKAERTEEKGASKKKQNGKEEALLQRLILERKGYLKQMKKLQNELQKNKQNYRNLENNIRSKKTREKNKKRNKSQNSTRKRKKFHEKYKNLKKPRKYIKDSLSKQMGSTDITRNNQAMTGNTTMNKTAAMSKGQQNVSGNNTKIKCASGNCTVAKAENKSTGNAENKMQIKSENQTKTGLPESAIENAKSTKGKEWHNKKKWNTESKSKEVSKEKHQHRKKGKVIKKTLNKLMKIIKKVLVTIDKKNMKGGKKET